MVVILDLIPYWLPDSGGYGTEQCLISRTMPSQACARRRPDYKRAAADDLGPRIWAVIDPQRPCLLILDESVVSITKTSSRS